MPAILGRNTFPQGPPVGTVDKRAPFDKVLSPWNIAIPGSPIRAGTQPTWVDDTSIHASLFVNGGDVLFRRDYNFNFWSNASSPKTWKFVCPGNFSGNSATYNRYNDLLLTQFPGPTTLCELAQPDHLLVLARDDTGDYIDFWQCFVDSAWGLVTGHPYCPNRGTLAAGQASATSMTGVSGASVGAWIGASTGVWALVTGGTATAPTFSGGWVYSDGTAAPTPAQYDEWFISPNVGTATSAPSSTSITDSSKAYGANALADTTRGDRLVITANAYMVITSNGATSITGSGGWRDLVTGASTSAPANGAFYYVTGDLPNGSWNPSSASTGNVITGLGMGGNLTSPPVSPGYSGPKQAGGRAANFAEIGGLLTGADRLAGSIDHALIWMGNSSILSSSTKTAPSTAPAGSGGGPLPTGARLGLPNTGSFTLDPSGKLCDTLYTARGTLTTASGIAIFDALVNYGAFLGDLTGGTANQFIVDGSSDIVSFGSYWATFWIGGSNDWDTVIKPLLRYTTDFPL